MRARVEVSKFHVGEEPLAEASRWGLAGRFSGDAWAVAGAGRGGFAASGAVGVLVARRDGFEACSWTAVVRRRRRSSWIRRVARCRSSSTGAAVPRWSSAERRSRPCIRGSGWSSSRCPRAIRRRRAPLEPHRRPRCAAGRPPGLARRAAGRPPGRVRRAAGRPPGPVRRAGRCVRGCGSRGSSGPPPARRFALWLGARTALAVAVAGWLYSVAVFSVSRVVVRLLLAALSVVVRAAAVIAPPARALGAQGDAESASAPDGAALVPDPPRHVADQPHRNSDTLRQAICDST